MIQTRNITSSIIEIYTDGGGYVTESYPTNFHTFATARPLAAGETVADYREVTAAEREAIEMIDAAFVRPPQLFIDEWNAACVFYPDLSARPWDKQIIGQYNEVTGYFELNGLKDITYDEAICILRSRPNTYAAPLAYSNINVRTNFPLRVFDASSNIDRCFMYNPVIEVARIKGSYHPGTKHESSFYSCKKLREVRTIVVSHGNAGVTFPTDFLLCPQLEYVGITNLNGALNLKDSPKIRLDCLQDIIRDAYTAGFPITVHPTVYARLTDEANEEWHALIAAAEAKNIVFATP